MRDATVIVETGLAEEVEYRGKAYVRHARTRRVVRELLPMPKAPEVGDPWDPLTVRARLHRLADVFRKLPHTPDTRPGGFRSCMPEPVREMWKDLPGVPMRLGVTSQDYRAAMAVLDTVVSLWKDDEKRIVLWAIALKISDRQLARELGCSHPTAAQRKLDVLKLLAERLPDGPDERDVQLARDSIHRNLT
jgi:hypothetical protein